MSMSQKILAVLGESPLPISTPDLIAIVAEGMSYPRSRVWTQLRAMLKSGLVTKEYQIRKGSPPVAIWKLA